MRRSSIGWLGAGQIDSAFAALGGFVAGVSAVRSFSPDELGFYALLFAGFAFASQIPTQLVLAPAGVIAARREESSRALILRWTLRRGLWVALPSALLAVLVTLPFSGSLGHQFILPMAATAVAFTAISPLQDHVRQVAHLAGRSTIAAICSVSFFASTGAALFLLGQLGPAYIPFGSLALGNVASATLGTWLLLRKQVLASAPSPWAELSAIGRWMLAFGLGSGGGRYIASAVVSVLAGPGALGMVERARIASRPADVVAGGLMQPIGPRLMALSAQGKENQVRRLRRIYFGLLLLIALALVAVTGFPHQFNPVFRLLPESYEVMPLFWVVLISVFSTTLSVPYANELLGKQLPYFLARAEFWAQVAQVLMSITALWIGLYALPFAQIAASAMRTWLLGRAAAQRRSDIKSTMPSQAT